MFKKAALTVLAVMVLAFAAGTSQAQLVTDTGLGDSLLYAYYSTKGSVNLLNIVNTDTVNGAKVRIVFRAGKNSEEILDYSICLSRSDVYTIFVADNGAGKAGVCGGADTDTITSAAVPAFPTCLDFRTGPNSLGLTADDMKEGYVEVLGLSMIPNYDKNATATTACPGAPTVPASPTNCIRTATACANWHCSAQNCGGVVPAVATSVPNSLFGTNLIVTADGGNYGYNATAVTDTTLVAVPDPGPGQELSLPLIADVGCGIEFFFRKSTLIAPYDVITGFGKTAVIVNFPTRNACHGLDQATESGDNTGVPGPGTGNLFTCANNAADGRCIKYDTPIFVRVFDDKENELVGQRCTVSPCPQVDATLLPNEINILEVGGTKNFTTGLGVNIAVGTFGLGWLDISLVNLNPPASPTFPNGPNAPLGLPAIGFSAQSAAGFTYMLPVQYIP